MKRLLFLFLSMMALADPNAVNFGYQLIFDKEINHIIVNTEHVDIVWKTSYGWKIPYHTCKLEHKTQDECFDYLSAEWMKPYTFVDFAAFAKVWVGEPVVDPLVPQPELTPDIIYVNENSKVVHRPDCRYVNPLTLTRMSHIEFVSIHLTAGDYRLYRGCLVCRPGLFFGSE